MSYDYEVSFFFRSVIVASDKSHRRYVSCAAGHLQPIVAVDFYHHGCSDLASLAMANGSEYRHINVYILSWNVEDAHF